MWQWLSSFFFTADEDFPEEVFSDEEVVAREERLPQETVGGRTSLLARAISPMGIVVCTPTEFSHARSAVRALHEGKCVIIRLTETEGDTAQRITDFVSGAVFLIEGSVDLQGDILVCTPETVRLEKDDFRLRANDMTMLWRMRD